MIKHIVMWKVKDSLNGKTKQELILEMKDRLECLPRAVPGLLQLEVGIPIGSGEDAAADLVLVTAFKDRAGLAHYDSHPEHEKVKPFMRERTTERRVADYEI